MRKLHLLDQGQNLSQSQTPYASRWEVAINDITYQHNGKKASQDG